MLAAVCVVAGAAFGKGIRKDADGVSHSASSLEERIKLIAPVQEGELRLRPTFVSCGVCFGAAKPIDGIRLDYRKKGAAQWQTLDEFPYFAETKDYRASILRLDEDTEYEVRVFSGSWLVVGDSNQPPATNHQPPTTKTFRTWKSEIKVAKTVEIDPATAKFPIRIADCGTPDGWIRYTMKGGQTLLNETKEITMVIDGATNVVVEGIVFNGGRGRHAVTVNNSKDVRIVNCQFSHWGREYRMRYDGLGRPFQLDSPKGKIVRTQWGGYALDAPGAVNFDGAVVIGRGSVATVVERCWFHDSRIHSNSWYYSHPCGNNGITFKSPDHSTVIRWCDFTGSDLHRWNDGIESHGNFDEDGGANRDADVYGNFVIFANDDCIELDGGQQNVRCFDNRFESSLCGVSVQGCMAGPSYVFGNGIFGLGEEFGREGRHIKTGGGVHGEDAYCRLADNLFWGKGDGLSWMKLLRLRMSGNIFCAHELLPDTDGCSQPSPGSSSVNDRFGVKIAEEELPNGLPVRPLGFVLDRSRFSGITLRKGVLSQETLLVRARSSVGRDQPFEVKINDDTPWLKVSPMKGVVPAGGETAFTVSFDTAQMNDRRHYRGAFIVRTPEGLSRGVSVYVATDFVPPQHPALGDAVAVYVPAKAGGGEVSLRAREETVYEYTFTVPKDGRYHFMFHVQGAMDGQKSAMVQFDDEPYAPSHARVYADYKVWAMVAPGNRFGNMLRFWDFKAGEKHTLRIKGGNGSVRFDELVMTDDPGVFEPR